VDLLVLIAPADHSPPATATPSPGYSRVPHCTRPSTPPTPVSGFPMRRSWRTDWSRHSGSTA